MRWLLIFLIACSSKSPAPLSPPKPIDDRAVRIKVAYAEARRGGGIAELVDLATHGAKHERILALRGLGRISGATSITALRTALEDRDRDIVAAAAAGIGLAASLDDEDFKVTDALLAAQRKHDHPAVIEALGRAGDASCQSYLAGLATQGNAYAAIALGRHGRRKIALSDEARDALGRATTLGAVSVRFAATWALAREHITSFDDPKIASVNAALSARLTDVDPEVRAQAVMAFARRKQVKAAAPAIEQRLIDTDWRVAVEAVRALSGDEYRSQRVAAAARSADSHVANEMLRSFIGKPIDAEMHAGLRQAIGKIGAKTADVWAVLVGIEKRTASELLASIFAPTRHIIVSDVIAWMKSQTADERRAVMKELLADNDVRVRVAAIAALPSQWKDSDPREQDLAIKVVTAAIAAKDPISSGGAIETADELYEIANTWRAELASALVQRADGEKDVELAASLYAIIGKRAIGAGAPACKQGLEGHPVLVKAAIECLKKLGEPVPELKDPPVAKTPFVDVIGVIGKQVTWRITTTRGELAIELLPDVAPWAVATIVTLTRRGYYDGLEFHRVVPNFVVQGGDPTESGWGGPGFMIPAEPASMLDGLGFVAGGVGIADAGRDSGGSQWFVMHSQAPHLDGRYTWVGQVASGDKAADALLIGDEVVRATIEIAD